MSLQATLYVWHLDLPARRESSKPALKLVLLALAEHADPEGQRMFPSVDRLTRYTGMSERSVRRALKRLRELGVLKQTAASTSRLPAEYAFPLMPRDTLTVDRRRGAKVTPPGGRGGTSRGATVAPEPSLNRQRTRAPAPEEPKAAREVIEATLSGARQKVRKAIADEALKPRRARSAGG